MTCRIWVLWAPVYLGNNNRSEINYWHRLVELINLIIWIGSIIATAIPSAVIVYGITDVITFDRMFGIATVILLPGCSWCPDDTSKAILTNLINNRLEIIVKSL